MVVLVVLDVLEAVGAGLRLRFGGACFTRAESLFFNVGNGEFVKSGESGGVWMSVMEHLGTLVALRLAAGFRGMMMGTGRMV